MIIKTGKICIQMLGGLGAGLAIIALLVAWQFYKGPVSLSFLTPYVEDALNSGHRSFHLAIDDTTLTWAGWDRALEIRVKNVRMVGEDGVAAARIPELSLSLSGPALLRGDLAPRRIELLGPELRVRRERDGSFGIELASKGEADGSRVATGLLHWLMEKPTPGSPMSYLNTVRITGATLIYDDLTTGKIWQAPVGNLRLDRASHGMLAEGTLLLELDDRSATIAVNGSYQAEKNHLDMTATFTDISPAALAFLDSRLAALSAVDSHLSGTVVLGFGMQTGIETVGFNVTGKEGRLALPLKGVAPMAFEALELRGLFDGASGNLLLDHGLFFFADGAKLNIPDPISHELPISSIRFGANVGLKTGKLIIEKLQAEMDGAQIALSLDVSPEAGGQSKKLEGNVILTNVPVDNVHRYWPASLGTDAREWVLPNLNGGTLIEAKAAFDLSIGEAESLKVNKLDGTMTVDGSAVTYMKGMPEVQDAAALISFDADTFDISIQRGSSEGIRIEGGTVHISGLREVDQFADIDVRLVSAFRNALSYIDHEPLGFAKEMGLSPAQTAGDAAVDLHLHLLLAKDLSLDDVEVSTKATLSKVEMKDVVLGRDIKGGELTLDVNKSRMEVEGVVLMEDIPASLKWTENFQADAPFTAIYELGASIDDIRKVRVLGIDPEPLNRDMVSGGVDATIRYTVFNERSGRLEVQADLSRAEAKLPLFNWRKASGDFGWASVTILLENGLIKSVPKFELSARDLSVLGDIVYAQGGLGIDRVNIDHLVSDRIDVSGAVISRPDGGWEIGLSGSELDISAIWSDINNRSPWQDEPTIPNLTIAVELDKVWFDQHRFTTNTSATLVHSDDIWRTVFLDGVLESGAHVDLRLTPDESGNRVLNLTADNAGDTLRFLDQFENMQGGTLELTGRFDDAAPGQPLRGRLRVADYRVRNAPMLARILSIMALTGILDAMTGEGLNFSELDVPFTFVDGVIDVQDAKATGTSLGFTASGDIYTHADVINLQGTVVPAYALNSLLGRIPLLGNLLTGTEEGGGMFAANFSVTGPTEDPKTTVNPLAALTPGIFRNILGALTPEQENVLQGIDPNQPLGPALP